MIADEQLLKCTTESEKDTAKFFDKLGLKCIDLGFKIYDKKKNCIGEIDGVFIDEENEVILIYDDSTQTVDVNTKITKFFTKWSNQKNENEIFDKLSVPHYPIYILYIDKSKLAEEVDTSSINYLLEENPSLAILQKDDFDYFHEISEKMGVWAKNDLYNFLNISPTFNRREINVTQIYIGETPAYIYADRPDLILKYSYVKRRRENDEGYQRMVDFKRVKEITEELKQNKIMGFPNSIILNSTVPISNQPLNKSKCPMQINIVLPNHYASCRIVDGQHRLLSFSQLNKLEQSRFSLPVVLFDNMPYEDEIRMFIDINDNSKKVESSLKYELISKLTWEETDKEFEIKKAVKLVDSLSKSAPIKRRVYKGVVGQTKKGHITLKSFVDSLLRYELVSNSDITDGKKLIQQVLIEINKQEVLLKEYLLSNRGLDLTLAIIQFFVNNADQKPIDQLSTEKITQFLKHTKESLDELVKFQGQGGNKQAKDILIEKLKATLVVPVPVVKAKQRTRRVSLKNIRAQTKDQ